MYRLKTYLTAFLFLMALCHQAMGQQGLPYRNASLPIEERVEDLLQRMTIDEKIEQMSHIHSFPVMENGKLDRDRFNQLMGGQHRGFIESIKLSGRDCRTLMSEARSYMRNARLGIPIFTSTESLHGSVQDGSTVFPQSIALGSTFNPELADRMVTAIAKELKAQGITQTLSPVLDVCRDLRWGRVEECFSEDPFLNSRMGVAEVKAYLKGGISPVVKHLGPHGNPTGGLNLASVACGEREVRSIYLKPFEAVVKETNPWAVMSSYNSWNNEPNSSSYWMMTQLLRHEWGFKGFIYSDWGAISMLNYFHHTARNDAEAAIQALEAGLDAEASSNCFLYLKQLVEKGVVDMAYVDQAVRRILRAKFAMGLFDSNDRLPDYEANVHTSEHVALAREIAEESIVLLKNQGALLPLDAGKLRSVALIGPNADQVQFGDYSWSCHNRDGVTLRQAMEERYGKQIKIRYAAGCSLMKADTTGLAEAEAAAKVSDLSIVVVGSASAPLARTHPGANCGEGFDLSSLVLPGSQEELIRRIHATGRPMVLVLLSGKPFVLSWEKEHVPAILVQWYPGEQGGHALADVLFGKVNPSGKLNYSFPQSDGHLPCYYNYLPTDKGYYHHPGSPEHPGRDYVFATPASLWAFGHGLSYTSFDYLSARTDREDYRPNDTISVEVTLRNSGARDGKEAVQLYVRDVVASVATPVQELKAFAKVNLKRGETRTVQLRIPVKELAIYNQKMERVVEPGIFELQIGSASDDIRIKQRITVDRDRMTPDPMMAVAPQKRGTADQAISTLQVKGDVTDVQGTPQKGISLRIGKRSTISDNDGRFALQGASNDTLHVEGKGIYPQHIPLQGRQVFQIRVTAAQ